MFGKIHLWRHLNQGFCVSVVFLITASISLVVISLFRFSASSCGGEGGCSTHWPPPPSQMRINLPRHDLCGEERWPVSQRRKALNIFPASLLSSAHIEIHSMQVKLINQCPKRYSCEKLTSFPDSSWINTEIISGQCGFSSNVCFLLTRQSKPQRKQCIFFLWPDSAPGAVCSSTGWVRQGEQSSQEIRTLLQKEWRLRLRHSWGVKVFLLLPWCPIMTVLALG